MLSDNSVNIPASDNLFRTKCNWVVDLNVAYFIALLLGTSFYILSPSLSLQNLLLVPTLPLNICVVVHRRLSKSIVTPLFFLILYIAILFCITPLLPDTGNNVKYVFYQLHILNIYLSAIIIPTSLFTFTCKFVKVALICWLILALTQLGVITGVLPQSLSFLFFKSARYDLTDVFQINGTFANANDFACVVFLLFLLLLLKSDSHTRRIYFAVSLIISMLAMSRTVIVLFGLLAVIQLWIKDKRRKLAKYSLIAFLIFSGIIMTKGLWEQKIYDALYAEFGYNAVTINFTRLTSIIEFEEDKHQPETSSQYRRETYLYALSKLPTHFTGTGAQNYGSFYREGGFHNQLVWTNPHSFLIEIGIAFGWLPLLIFLIFLGCIFYGILKQNKIYYRRYLIVLFSFTIILSNIPATGVQIPLLWLPLIYAYIFVNKSTAHKIAN